jgi:peptide deformylase
VSEPMPAELRPSERMRRLGVIQRGDPRLRRRARRFDLPREEPAARALVARLVTTMDRIAQVHVFGKGMGLAAPQVGVGRAAAVVRPAGGDEPIVLLNPTVLDRGEETDEQYEGCLSFFDLRGLVPRALALTVSLNTLDGGHEVRDFGRGLARLVAHEIDHLDGVLYPERMRPGVVPIDVEEYRGTGSAWRY